MNRASDLPPHVPARMAGIPAQYPGMPGAFPGMGMMDIKPGHLDPIADLAARARAYLSDPAAAAMDLSASMRSAMGMGGPPGAFGPGGMGIGQNMDDFMFTESNRPDK
jgi:hypothetical protein